MSSFLQRLRNCSLFALSKKDLSLQFHRGCVYVWFPPSLGAGVGDKSYSRASYFRVGEEVIPGQAKFRSYWTGRDWDGSDSCPPQPGFSVGVMSAETIISKAADEGPTPTQAGHSGQPWETTAGCIDLTQVTPAGCTTLPQVTQAGHSGPPQVTPATMLPYWHQQSRKRTYLLSELGVSIPFLHLKRASWRKD